MRDRLPRSPLPSARSLRSGQARNPSSHPSADGQKTRCTCPAERGCATRRNPTRRQCYPVSPIIGYWGCHPRVSGGPQWIPASAGMTTLSRPVAKACCLCRGLLRRGPEKPHGLPAQAGTKTVPWLLPASSESPQSCERTAQCGSPRTSVFFAKGTNFAVECWGGN